MKEWKLSNEVELKNGTERAEIESNQIKSYQNEADRLINE